MVPRSSGAFQQAKEFSVIKVVHARATCLRRTARRRRVLHDAEAWAAMGNEYLSEGRLAVSRQRLLKNTEFDAVSRT